MTRPAMLLGLFLLAAGLPLYAADIEIMVRPATRTALVSATAQLLLAKIQLKRQNLEGVADQLEIYLREAPRGPGSERIRQDREKYRSRP